MDKFLRGIIIVSLLCIATPALAIKTIPGKTPNITYGAGSHIGPADTDIATKMALMQTYGLTTLRFDLISADDTTPTTLLDVILAQSPTYGITLHPIIFIPYTFQYPSGSKTDGGRYPNTDAGVYQSAYDRTYALVSVYGDRIRDWEFENELTLLSNFKSGNGPSSSDYATTGATTWAQGYKGFSDAIAAVQAAHPAWANRRVVDFVYIDFGFPAFLAAAGGVVDKVAYHYYYDRRTSPTNIAGTGGPYNLWSQFASIGKPVIINEFNAGEVYDPYTNLLPTTPEMIQLGLVRHLEYISSQSTANIEGVELYELYDEPAKAVPENNFGIAHDATTNKISMLIAAHYDGAHLSAADNTLLRNAAARWNMTRKYPLSGLTAWYESSDPAQITSSSNVVSAWADKSLNGNNTTATGTEQPTTNSVSTNGINGLDFDGTTDQLTMNSGMYSFPANTDSTVIIVHKPDTDGNHFLFSLLNASSRYRVTMSAGGITFTSGAAGTGTVLARSFDSNAHIIVARKTGATLEISQDGSSTIATGSAGTEFTATSGYIGSQNLSNFYDGTLYDIKFYSRSLSNPELDQICKGLSIKYNITWTDF